VKNPSDQHGKCDQKNTCTTNFDVECESLSGPEEIPSMEGKNAQPKR